MIFMKDNTTTQFKNWFYTKEDITCIFDVFKIGSSKQLYNTSSSSVNIFKPMFITSSTKLNF